MSQDAVSVQGSRTYLAKQTDFITKQTTGFKDVREEEPTAVASFAKVAQTPSTNYRDPNQQDKPITYGEPVDDALKITTLTHQAETAGEKSVIVQSFEAGGWTVESGNNTTSTGTPTATAIDMTADNFDAGVCATFQMPSGQYEIALCAADDGTTFTPAMGLSAAPTSGHAINKCFTITPGDEGVISDADYLTITNISRALDGAENVTVVGTGCAMATVDPFVMEVGTLPQWVFHFNAGKLEQDSESALGANTFLDGEETHVWDSPIFNFANANSSGAIAHTCENIVKATFDPGQTIERIIAQGCASSNLNNTAGYLHTIGPQTLEIEMYWDVAKLNDWEGTNASKYIAIQRTGSSASVPAVFICMPNAHLMDPPEVNLVDAPPGFAKITAKYTGRPAGFESIATAGATENAPCYIGISDTSA
jgi:hypothetical protein